MADAGESFLHYKLISRIGSGGMGEVYLAKDRLLERKVAIKILRKKFSQNGESLRRFVLEAKSASALNHPNIITIYEIGESEGTNYIASEYIDGRTLHARLEKNPPNLPELLNIAIQTAEAVTAAHAAGIVHRDIKPENVMIRKDGYVKVLDFGLAKLTEHNQFSADFDADTQTMVETNPGIIMGTVAYMSPEQARARDIDGRSDIWSLGVVMYEMITGMRPFTGDTASDVIAAILRAEPVPISRLVPDVPKELEHIVVKALRKDRDERYQHIKDMLIDLKDLLHDLDLHIREGRTMHQTTDGTIRPDTTEQLSFKNSATASAAGHATNSISEMFMTQFRLHPKSMMAGLAGFILLITAGIIGLRMSAVGNSSSGSFQTMRLTKLTTSGNAEAGEIAVSPDGKYAVYVVKEQSKQSLWVRHIATASNVLVVPPAEAEYRGLTFSRDGSYIFFTTSERRESSTLYRVSVFGGDVRKVLADADTPISSTSGDERFLFLRREKTLLIANSDGTNVQTLAEAGPGNYWRQAAWSPDGSMIAAAQFSAADSNIKLLQISVRDGKVLPIASPPWLRVSGLAWLPDSRGLVLSGRDLETQLSQIWLISYPDGKLTRVTNDLANYLGVSLTADGKTLVSIQENRVSNIWINKSGSERKITSDLGKDDGLSGVAWAPDGRVVYTTRVTGGQDLWIVNSDGGNNRQLTFDAGSNYNPAVSPDGRSIAFVSTRSGNVELWKMDTDGGNPVRLTETDGIEGHPDFTPDGMWIMYGLTAGDDTTSIWKIPAAGGDPVQVTKADSMLPVVSPDGKYFACRYREYASDKSFKIAVFSIDGGEMLEKLDIPAVVRSPILRWSADGSSLLYMENSVDGSGSDLKSQSFNDKPSATLVSGSKGERIFFFAVSRNSDGIALARGNETSDAVMITNFR